MSSPLRAEGFSCGKIFRESYSMFLFRSPNFLINLNDMVFTYKNVPMQGTMYFNMCGMSSFRDICGDQPVSGRFIFRNKSGIPGTPDCLVMNEKEDSWTFTRFAADSQSVNLEGVKVRTPTMEVEAIGGLAEEMDNFLEEKQTQLMDGLNDLGLDTVVNNPLFKQATGKIQLDSSRQGSVKYRLLAKNNQTQSAQKKGPSTPIEIIQMDDSENQIQTQVQNKLLSMLDSTELAKQNNSTLQVPSTSRSPQFLKPQEKTSTMGPGQDVIEEGNAVRAIIEKRLKEHLQSTMAKGSQQDQSTTVNKSEMRVLSSSKTELTDFIPEQVTKVFDMEIETEFNFYCDSNEPKMVLHHLPRSNLLEVNVYSSDGCVVNFEFLQVLNEIPWLTGTIFMILGVGLALFGIKVYRNLLIVFIPMMIAILGFYLYFAVVENKSTSTTKILTLVGLLVFIFIIAVLMVWFNWLIYLIIAFGVSCQFGLLAHSFLAESVEFFTKPYTEWILIGLFFVLFTIMYIVAKDYFVILSTAIMGAMFIVLSLKYFGVTDFDLLFDAQIDKFADFENLDKEVKTMCFVFIGVVLFGLIVQVILLKRQQKQEEAENPSKMQDIHNDHNKNINIQLENI